MLTYVGRLLAEHSGNSILNNSFTCMASYRWR